MGEEFIFFVDDMMQMSTDDRKEYATRGAFQQILIEFTNAIENRFKKYRIEKMELYNDKIVTQKSLLNDGTKTGFSIEDSENIHDKDEDSQDRQKEEEESVSNVP